MRQRRQQGGRPHKHSVRMSEAEQAVIEERAGQAGVSVPRFLVEAAMAGDTATASQLRANAAELLAARRLVAAAGVSLNQLAKVANATGVVPASLEATMTATQQFLERLDAAAVVYGDFGLPFGRRAADSSQGVADPGLDVGVDQDHGPGGLVRYLFGPGSSQEHTDQRIIAADVTLGLAEGTRLDHVADADAIYVLGRDMDSHRILLGAAPPGGWVWHCAISLPPSEVLADEQWAEIARTAIGRMGFEQAADRAPCRWIAVHHGRSVGGNDHIHLMVNLVREDGTLAAARNDRRTMSRVCADMERRYELAVVEGRAGRGMPGYSKAEHQRMRVGALPERQRLARLVRSCALISADEAEFVRRARRSGLSVRPRYGTDGQSVVGYSVALRGREADAAGRPVWFGGGRLAADLSLPRLREHWPPPPRRVRPRRWRSGADRPTSPAPRSRPSGPSTTARCGARPSPGWRPSPPSSARARPRTRHCGRAPPATPPD
ncbi:relaxase/mobilization nuclease domain-containing protein [Streptosporangium sp. NBC_01756]|uniref:relaxase/mobilization nuclease domain-containing protein n=1 Tax=Streptosporangium sp. NBC_01756 TaxID=2975950 RepID=UPI002DDBF9C2|nr:relaxase/mobilization nuclease domain-containing protein [Streptosporangium sp. NBC_01756]WSC86311.1 relaxase/mobilization nuclease domain-containing protein [Streptosporangium sp. NBC_01756]